MCLHKLDYVTLHRHNAHYNIVDEILFHSDITGLYHTLIAAVGTKPIYTDVSI